MTVEKSIPPDESSGYKALVEQIGDMFELLQRMLKANLPIFENEANAIIARKETDGNKIMWQLDHLLSYTMHGVGADVYFKLIDHLRTIDEEAAKDYMEYYKEQQEG